MGRARNLLLLKPCLETPGFSLLEMTGGLITQPTEPVTEA